MTRPWKNVQRWITIPDGSKYAVEARGKDAEYVELHGGFADEAAAERYRRELIRDFSDYEYAKVVTLNISQASLEKA